MKTRILKSIILLFTAFAAAGCSMAVAGNEKSGVDVDLTLLSGNLAYAEMGVMLANPDDYMGKTVKISGSYVTSYYDLTELTYHYVALLDVTTCCQQAIEFILEDAEPGDYPEIYANIEITGIFGVYDELGRDYCFLAVDSIKTL